MALMQKVQQFPNDPAPLGDVGDAAQILPRELRAVDFASDKFPYRLTLCFIPHGLHLLRVMRAQALEQVTRRRVLSGIGERLGHALPQPIVDGTFLTVEGEDVGAQHFAAVRAIVARDRRDHGQFAFLGVGPVAGACTKFAAPQFGHFMFTVP